MLKIKNVTASEIKAGDRITNPEIIKPYLTPDGLLPNELSDAFNLVLKVGTLKDVAIEKRNEILNSYNMDTVIIMVKITGDLDKGLRQFVPNGTMNEFHSPTDIITVLLENDN